MTNTEAQRRIAILRRKQQLIPVIAEKFAQQIMEEILQGDALVDEVEELAMELEPPSDFEDAQDFTNQLDEYLVNTWSAIMHRVHAKIQELEK